MLKIGENALLKRELRELKYRGMILVQYRENHRIWELKEGVEQRWTCGEVEYYAVETEIYGIGCPSS